MSDKIKITEFLKKIPDIIPKIETTIREVNGDIEVTSTYGEHSVFSEMGGNTMWELEEYHGIKCDEKFFKDMSCKNLLTEIALKECDLWGYGEENLKKHIAEILNGIYGK